MDTKYNDIETLIKYLNSESILKVYNIMNINFDKNKEVVTKKNVSGCHLRINELGYWIDYTNELTDFAEIVCWLIKKKCYYNENKKITTRYINEQKKFHDSFEKTTSNIIKIFDEIKERYTYIQLLDINADYSQNEEYIITSQGILEYRFTSHIIVEFQICDSYNMIQDFIALNFNPDKDYTWIRKELINELNLFMNIILLPHYFTADLIHMMGRNIDCIASPFFSGRLIHESIGHYSEADIFYKSKKGDFVFGNKVCNGNISVVDYAGGLDVPYSFCIDEEGTVCSDVWIVKDGVFVGILADKNLSKQDNFMEAGFVRSYGSCDSPLIRMRNTALLPGVDNINEMFLSMSNGIYLNKYIDGRTTEEGIFEVMAKNAYIIIDNKVIGVIDKLKIGSNVNRFLESISMVSSDFSWYDNLWCSKEEQNILVSFGSPTIKCKLDIIK